MTAKERCPFCNAILHINKHAFYFGTVKVCSECDYMALDRGLHHHPDTIYPGCRKRYQEHDMLKTKPSGLTFTDLIEILETGELYYAPNQENLSDL